MAYGAHLAGKAINISKTTAPHAILYPLTSFFDIPHGHAVGLTLSTFLVFNANVTEKDVLDGRGVKYVKETINEICGLLGAKTVWEAKEKIDALFKKIDLKMQLSSLGLQKKDIELIIANSFNVDRAKNNPRRLTKDALRKIIEEIL